MENNKLGALKQSLGSLAQRVGSAGAAAGSAWSRSDGLAKTGAFLKKNYGYLIVAGMLVAVTAMIYDAQVLHPGQTIGGDGAAAGYSPQVVTGFADFNLEENQLTASVDNKPTLETITASMPKTLDVYLGDDEEITSIPVSWECLDDDYSESTMFYFQFSPQWDETEYVLDEGLDIYSQAPYVAVFLDNIENIDSHMVLKGNGATSQGGTWYYMGDGSIWIEEGSDPTYYDDGSGVVTVVSNTGTVWEGNSSDEISSDEYIDAPGYDGQPVAVNTVRTSTGSYSVTGSSYEKAIFTYLVDEMGLNAAAACGVMANAYCESSFNPINLEGIYERSLGYTDQSYTDAVDNGTYTNFGDDSAGYGIFQWTYYTHKRGLLAFAKEKGTSIGDWKMQMQYLEQEMQNEFKNVWSYLTSVPNTEQGAYDAAYYWCYYYEKPKNYPSVSVTRGNLARNTYWREYGDYVPGSGSIVVSVPESSGGSTGSSSSVIAGNGSTVTNTDDDDEEMVWDEALGWVTKEEAENGTSSSSGTTSSGSSSSSGTTGSSSSSSSGSTYKPYSGSTSSGSTTYKSYSGTTYSGSTTTRRVSTVALKLDTNTKTISVGDAFTLKAAKTPSNATDVVSWSSSNTSIASVMGGKVTGKANGECVITARTSNGKYATCKVKVCGSLAAPKATLSAEKIDQGNAVTVNWDKQNNADGYRVYITTDKETTKKAVAKDKTTYSFEPKEVGTYTIYVQAYNDKAKKKSSEMKLTVQSAQKLTLSAKKLNLVTGDKETLTATVDPKSDTKITWKSSNAKVAAVSNGTIKAVAPGTCTIEATTAEGAKATCKVTVDVKNKAKIVDQPESVTVQAGDLAKFTVYATGDDLTYSWEYRKSEDGSWKACDGTGSTTAILSVDAAKKMSGYQYRCTVTDAGGNTAVSSAATLTVGYSAPVVLTEPRSCTAADGGTAEFSVEARGDDITYHWEQMTDGSWGEVEVYRTVLKEKEPEAPAESESSPEGETPGESEGESQAPAETEPEYEYVKERVAVDTESETLVIPVSADLNGTYFRCVITDANGKSVTTDKAKLTVGETQSMKITEQPKDQKVKEGANAVFSVAAEGTGLTYQWQYRYTNSTTWHNCKLETADSSSLKIMGTAARNGMLLRCMVSSSDGNRVYSTVAVLNV